MRQKHKGIYDLPIEMHRNHETIFVAADIKYNYLPAAFYLHSVRRRIGSPELREIVPPSYFHDPNPILQITASIWVRLRSLPQE